MHPELLSSLAAERRRDIAAGLRGRRAPRSLPGGPRRARLARHRVLPFVHVTWTWTSLAAATGRRGRSWVVVISATRTF
jgi:hypothetical protein